MLSVTPRRRKRAHISLVWTPSNPLLALMIQWLLLIMPLRSIPDMSTTHAESCEFFQGITQGENGLRDLGLIILFQAVGASI